MAVYVTDLLWGCPQMNFKANPPFNEMRQGFATFKKETRMPQYLPELIENLQKKILTNNKKASCEARFLTADWNFKRLFT
ncbi:MAG: hypothetical protein ABIN18_10750 [Pseudomonadota bacterium]